jgi:hypothetical protein
LLTLSCKSWFSFWTWVVFSSFIFISCCKFSMIPLRLSVYPIFKLTWDIS